MVHEEEKVMPGTDMNHRLYFHSCVSLVCFIILELNLSRTLLAVNKTKAQPLPAGITFIDNQRNPLLMLIKKCIEIQKGFSCQVTFVRS